MKFSDSHEWIEFHDNNQGTIGVSSFAKKELGDIVFVELPHIGKKVQIGQEIAVLESTKSAVDLYSPVSGTIIEVNQRLFNNIELINTSPEKEGWLVKINLNNPSELENLMDQNEYILSVQVRSEAEA